MSHLIAPGDGHVVEYPVVLVVHQHPLLQQGQPLHALPIPHTVALLTQHLLVKSYINYLTKKFRLQYFCATASLRFKMFLIITKIVV
jgi:hypothetical protein